jgi:VWFA-related protein
LSNRVLAGSLALALLGAQAGQAGQAQPQAAPPQAAQQTQAQQAIPDAPKPQTSLPNLRSVTPGQGTTPASAGDSTPNRAAGAPPAAPPASPAPAPAAGEMQPAQAPTYETPSNEAANAQTLRVQVNDVNVPFTVKDSKGKLVPGLHQSDIRVYENGRLQPIVRFTTDPAPLSVALVIDQSLNFHDMERVNGSLGALPSAFAPYDEIAVFKYNNGPNMVTDYTGSQSARLTQAIELSKGEGREPLMAGSLSGPLAQTTVINNQNFDPNTAAQRGHTGIELNPPKEVHTLNDAILRAATSLSKKPIERRRVIYVISDGKEYGSKAKFRDVVKYLQTNNIEVDGTLVGDSSLPIIGFLDRLYLPLTMRDNLLPAYASATGGNFDAEFLTDSIEKSFAKIAAEVRNRYTLDFISHLPLYDGKYRTLEVKVIGHGNDLTILTKRGYYPTPQSTRPWPAATQ